MSAETLSDLERLLAEQDEPQLNADEYKQVFRQHPAGVAVVTFNGSGTEAVDPVPVGFTATSVISVSAAPPLLAFSIASTSSSWPALSQTGTVVVNFLDGPSAHLSTTFATSGIDRFADAPWHRLSTGEPTLTEACARVRGRVVQRIPAGDSYLVTLRALSAQIPRTGSPLVYHDRSYHQIGGHSRLA
ncbi:flavin reductase family protein [Occultella kanbiaonis]|uniref:flavin reductase family protein n=1 Tax=Occultella kanbiaonis TaxID=2675754 RepID=UPI0012B9F6B3|nr:flavin reductase family protein [Occultella kanbiaonis]